MHDAWQQLADEGYDLSLIEHNLGLSVAERIRDQSDAAESVERLQAAMRTFNAGNDRLPETAEQAR